jgi:pimeloyl-ACP methyl ester carboxylesterase
MLRGSLLLGASVAAGLQLGIRGPSPRTRACDIACAAAGHDAEDALLKLLNASGTDGRGLQLSAADNAEVHRLAATLESEAGQSTTNDSPLLPGRWRVLYQGKPGGETVSAFSLDSWRKYLSGDGPSPIQNLVSGSSGVSRLYQIVELADDRSAGRILNVVDASPTAVVAIEAGLDGAPSPTRLGFRFTGGRVLLRTLWNGTLDLPYPVPFDLLGENAKGWLQTDYITPKLRLSRGNKGSLFVLSPEPEPDEPELEAYLTPPSAAAPPASTDTATSKKPVLVCPAQFGTDKDYADLVDGLCARGHRVAVAPLVFTDWLRLIPASLTREYWTGELSPDVALPFYYEALDKATEQLQRELPGEQIQLVAHSIGGWVVRSYLGQLSDEKRRAFSALVTLGTPHTPPPEGTIWRKVDQTRGLLNCVEARYPGAFHPELRYMTVGSAAQRGALLGSGEGLVAGSLAYASYLTLCGDAMVEGDGITPLACAHLDGAEQREVDAFHIAFVPGLGARLLGTPWYGSEGKLEQWADFLE